MPFAPHWDKNSVLPGTTALKLKAGQCFIRSGTTIHRGHGSKAERLTLSGGWSAELSPDDFFKAEANPAVVDVRHAWQFDPGKSPSSPNPHPILTSSSPNPHPILCPALREALPHAWMKEAYDRWAATVTLGTNDEDVLAGWVIETLKQRREAEEEEADAEQEEEAAGKAK